MNFEASLSELAILFLTALGAGFVDAIAGGGGLITIPVLLTLGVPPHLALGTNKLQASLGTATAAFRYSRSELLIRDNLPLGIGFTLTGAVTGTLILSIVSPDVLRLIIPFALAVIFLYTLFSPRMGEIQRPVLMQSSLFYPLAGLTLGAYDGFLGPGTGSFWTIFLIIFMGYTLKNATANTKIMNLSSNLGSLGVFIVKGSLLWFPGLVMGAGQICGAWMGSHLVITRGTRFIRFFFLTVVGLTILNLLKQTFWGG